MNSPPSPNNSIQRMGANRSVQFQSVRQRRLAPAADAERYASINRKHKQQQLELEYETEHQMIRPDLRHFMGVGAVLSYVVVYCVSWCHGENPHSSASCIWAIGFLQSSVIGLVYAFFDALIGGAIFAWLYNKLAGCGEVKKPSQP